VTFELLPVVHVENRRFPEYPGTDPERALTELSRRFGRVVLVDAGGVRANDPDIEFLQTAARKRSLWIDAGSRFATDAMDLFIAGAEAVTLRWNTLKSADELTEAASLCQPGSLFVGLEFPRGVFLKHRKDARAATEVVRFAESLSVGVVFQLDRPDTAFLRTLPPAMTPRYAQGVNASAAAQLQELGFQGALVAPAGLPVAEARE
jgi:hypothetical protein